MTLAMKNLKDYYIRTNSGLKFYPYNPRPEQIHISDIACGLSKMCRYSGQINSFYSVAEHSIHVSLIVHPNLRLAALLHDASEAYIGDVPRPVKMGLPDYESVESGVMRAIADRFGVPHERFSYVKAADVTMLKAEFVAFMGERNFREEFPGDEYDQTALNRIYCWSHHTALKNFMDEFEDCKCV